MISSRTNAVPDICLANFVMSAIFDLINQRGNCSSLDANVVNIVHSKLVIKQENLICGDSLNQIIFHLFRNIPPTRII